MTTQTESIPTSPDQQAPNDPRAAFAAAVQLGRTVLAGVRPDQFDNATPCLDFDVRTLADHVVGVLERVAHVGGGGHFDDAPVGALGIADAELVAAYDSGAAELERVWSDDAVLTRLLTLPWAQLPGWIALSIYVNEMTVHTWDLAMATGQTPSWDEDVIRLSYDTMQLGLPAEGRDDPAVPFDPVVEVPADAPAIDRLVAWNGRRP